MRISVGAFIPAAPFQAIASRASRRSPAGSGPTHRQTLPLGGVCVNRTSMLRTYPFCFRKLVKGLPLVRDLILSVHDHVWHGWSPLNRPMPMLVRGRGTYLWDAEGKRYIDAVSSSMNAVCGYGRQRVVEAARRQMNELHHFDHSMGANAPAARLAQRIAQLLPGPLSRTFFANSGSEAVEAATRIALDYWANAGEQRTRVMTFAVGYHGCTLLARNLNAPR